MTPLANQLGLGERELVSLVGGGGKTTMLFALGNGLASQGRRVVLTTTTKMSRDQALSAPTVCWSASEVSASLGKPGPLMLVGDIDDHKISGAPPEVVDHLFETSDADYIIVEADGSRGKPLKAPGPNEPVVPSLCTTVVILIGIDAVGRRLDAVAHRVEAARRFTGLEPDAVVTPRDCVDILMHPDGVLRPCPPAARVVVAITKVSTEADFGAADEMERLLLANPRVDTVIVIPRSTSTTV